MVSPNIMARHFTRRKESLVSIACWDIEVCRGKTPSSSQEILGLRSRKGRRARGIKNNQLASILARHSETKREPALSP